MNRDDNRKNSCEEVDVGDAVTTLTKQVARVSYPALNYNGSDRIYINAAARSLFQTDYVRIGMTAKYIIFSPATTEQFDTFSITQRKGERCKNFRVPAALREKKLSAGTYRLYRCKGGCCIKRYEPEFVKEVKRNG